MPNKIEIDLGGCDNYCFDNASKANIGVVNFLVSVRVANLSKIGSMSMGDFVFYFLAGMFGEELMRKIATRRYGVFVLWFIGFVLINVCIFMFLVLLFIVSFVKVGALPGLSLLSSIMSGLRDLLSFFFVTMQPEAVIFSLGMGFLFALGYLWHYRKNSNGMRK